MDLVLTEGDLVICDATVSGPGGYYSDFARTFCHGAPARADRDRYAEAYATLQEAIGYIKPGPCSAPVRALRPDLDVSPPGPGRLSRRRHVHLRSALAPGL